MSSSLASIVAVDGMGGDHAPHEPVLAAAAISQTTTIHTILVGNPEILRTELNTVPHNPEKISIQPAFETVSMSENPRSALQKKPDASIAVAAKLVADGSAQALVSAGSTGALILAASQHIPLIAGIERAALAAVYPTRDRSFSNDRFSLLLDVGATVHCAPEHLLHFAFMGAAYARRISKVPRPSIGLLNVGQEDTKGDEVLTRAHQLLRDCPDINFIGNVEGTDIPKGVADVIVCEGFVGNVVLKMAEGMGEVLTGLGAWAFKKSLWWRLGLRMLASGISQLKTVTDYREYGGAPFLGFQKIVMKSHGRSQAKALENAIKVAAKAVRDNVCDDIAAAVRNHPSPPDISIRHSR